MSILSNSLVAQLRACCDDLAAAITALPPDEWPMCPPGELRSAGAIAYHTAAGIPITYSFVDLILRGESFPGMDAAAMHQANADQAAEHAGVTPAEVLSLLEANYQAVATSLAGLSGEQLAQTGSLFGHTLSVQMVVEGMVLRHILEHSAVLRTFHELAQKAVG